MLYAARIQLVDNVIKPALARGQWVIGDRHDLSSQAYQGGGRGIDRKLMESLRDTVLGIFILISPCISICRRKPAWPAPAAGRAGQNRTGITGFLPPHPARYLELAESDPRIVTVDASQSIDNVHQSIRTAVLNWLAQQEEA